MLLFLSYFCWLILPFKFGFLQTISKETTGPPTIIPRESNRRTDTTERKQIVSNDFMDFTYTQEVNADCVEHYDKVWNTKSDSVVEVCVYVCTVTTTILEGDELFDSNVQKTHSECPNPSAWNWWRYMKWCCCWIHHIPRRRRTRIHLSLCVSNVFLC